ncbi:MAG: DUF2235 domain-containing protein [Pseudomonadota bacterium]
MTKTLVLLFDGTSNEIEENRTNILRLYGTLKKDDQQIVYYDPGVGTIGSTRGMSRIWRKTVEIWGMAFGRGLDGNVLEAYRFLVDTYAPGDRVFVMGFSRGAYTARVLAGFLHAFGLMQPRNLNLLGYAYRAYKAVKAADPTTFKALELHKRILQPAEVAIDGMALFDTVASVFEPGAVFPRLRSLAHTTYNPSVSAVRHALAMDERRIMFRPLHWPSEQTHVSGGTSRPQDNKEVWFAGVHGDIGGGYPEAKSALAKIPLEWMIRETETLGLRFDRELVDALVLGKDIDGRYTSPDANAPANRSLNAAWSLLEIATLNLRLTTQAGNWLALRLTAGTAREIKSGARIHASVLKRLEARTTKPPGNLPETYETEL